MNETVSSTAIYDEAKQYLTVIKALNKKGKFNPQTLTNIACMAAEQFMVSYLMAKNHMPVHHSLDALIDEVCMFHKDIPTNIKSEVYFLEEFQNLCVIENIGMKVPTKDDLERIINTLTAIDVLLFP